MLALPLPPRPSPSRSSSPTLQNSHQHPPQAPSMNVVVRPISAKRPNLSLQTCIVPAPNARPTLSLSCVADTPTIRNTQSNAFSSCATPLPVVQTAIPSSGSSDSSSASSPDTMKIPYTHSHAARSILRNGPLPRLPRSATYARRPMFPLTKRVCFADCLTTTMPTPVIEDYAATESESSDSDAAAPKQRRRRRRSIGEGAEYASNGGQDEEGACSTPMERRPRKRREWVWTIGNAEGLSTSGEEPGQSHVQLRIPGAEASAVSLLSPSQIPLPPTPAALP